MGATNDIRVCVSTALFTGRSFFEQWQQTHVTFVVLDAKACCGITVFARVQINFASYFAHCIEFWNFLRIVCFEIDFVDSTVSID